MGVPRLSLFYLGLSDPPLPKTLKDLKSSDHHQGFISQHSGGTSPEGTIDAGPSESPRFDAIRVQSSDEEKLKGLL